MRRLPEGTPCKLYYDADVQVLAGHYIVSSGGSGYLVQEARRSQKKPQRINLKCLRCDPKNIPDGAVIHGLVWYSRNPKRKHP